MWKNGDNSLSSFPQSIINLCTHEHLSALATLLKRQPCLHIVIQLLNPPWDNITSLVTKDCFQCHLHSVLEACGFAPQVSTSFSCLLSFPARARSLSAGTLIGRTRS